MIKCQILSSKIWDLGKFGGHVRKITKCWKILYLGILLNKQIGKMYYQSDPLQWILTLSSFEEQFRT